MQQEKIKKLINNIVDFDECTVNGKHSWLIEYYKAIKAGEITVGHELRDELNNLIDDLKDERFIYDTSNSDLRIEFIETFCKHTKSPFNGMPFVLELWEKAFIEAFFSFKWKDTKLRRFKKAILLIARKNGKSTLCAALCLTELMVGNGGADIICSSNDDAQASIIFDEINNMREYFDTKEKMNQVGGMVKFHPDKPGLQKRTEAASLYL